MDTDKATFPLGTVWMGSDFAQNAVIKNQNETQSEYFNPKQVTLYNVVILRHAEQEIDGQQSTEENRIIIKEYIHVLSDDMQHDQEAVRVFHTDIWRHLKSRGVEQKRWHWWSDGGPEHFKNSAAFADMTSYNYPEFDNLVINRSFGATAHMKGEWDGTGTHVKGSVERHLLAWGADIIMTAEAYFMWCRDNLTTIRASSSTSCVSRAKKVTLSRRNFLYNGANSMARAKRTEKVEPVQAIHQLFVRPTVPPPSPPPPPAHPTGAAPGHGPEGTSPPPGAKPKP